jgi:GNAT superfamily N-acetyltransferase
MKSYRQVFPREISQYQEHLQRLDEESRAARFSYQISDANIQKYCAKIDWRHARLIGYFEDGILRAVADIRYDTGASHTNAELAFSVERPYQNSRIGSHLMARALISLRNQGVSKVHVVCLVSNRRMRTMATRYRPEVSISCGDVTLTIDSISDYAPGALEGLATHMAELLFDPPEAGQPDA